MPHPLVFRRRHDTVVAACVLALFAARAGAMQAPNADAHPSYAADTVRVESARPSSKSATFASPAFTTVLPAVQSAEAFADIAERLAHAAGVTVRSYGGPNALATVSIRGSSASQVDVYYDGIPLSRSRDGIARLTDLPLLSLSHIEIVRGAAPVGVAGAPVGGAINMVPLALPPRALTWHVAGGSFRTTETALAAGWGSSNGAWRVTAHGAALTSAGDFRYRDDNGTSLVQSDDEIVPRRNNALRNVSAGAIGTRALSRCAALTVLLDGTTYRAGMPGLGAVQATAARFASDHLLGHARLRVDVGGAQNVTGAMIELGAYDFALRERLTDRLGELGGGNQDNENRTALTGARARVLLRGPGEELEAVAELEAERLHATDLWPRSVTYPLVRRTTRRLAVEERWTTLGGRVLLAPSYRVEHTRARSDGVVRIGAALPVRANGLAPRATTESPALATRVAPVSWCVIKGHTGRYRRLPTFTELFGERGTVTGNPRLHPETGTHSDVGIALQRNAVDRRSVAVRAEVAAFRVRVQDLVVFVQNSQRTSVAQNIGRAHIDGLETTLSLGVGRALQFDANATLETARDASGDAYTRGRLLPGRPLREAFAAVLLRHGVCDVRAEMALASGSYLDRANRVPLAARAIASLGASWHLRRGDSGSALTLTCTVKNVANVRVFDVAGYPLPGRALYVALDRSSVTHSTEEEE
jgi:iron complex outermembrane receptor protein